MVTALAAILPVTNDAAGASSLTGAITASPVVATFLTVPGGPGTPHAVADAPLSSFPTNGGTFAILTTGNSAFADDANSDGFTGEALGGGNFRGDTDFDVSVLQIDLNVPAAANCLTFDFQFYSEEFPEFVGTDFNDAFIAELDASTWTTAGSVITAPNNFAFDTLGDVISINSTGVGGMNLPNAAGTTYDGATVLLSASTEITTPGAHTLYLSIFDQADQIYDSAVFVDNLVVGFVPDPAQNCAQGATPIGAFCGDGNLDAGEACDDGNAVDGDGCSTACVVEFCGDGNTDLGLGEACDDFNTTGGDGCSATCTIEACGNGTLDVGEACDDKNTTGGDGCSATCTIEACGNGTLDVGEACDDGNTISGDGCDTACVVEFCGDGIAQSGLGEACDDGTAVNGDGCSTACVVDFSPICSAATAGPSQLWPPNHKLVGVNINGVTDPDGDPVTIVATSVRQDEPTTGQGQGAGNTFTDASLTPLAVRSERNGNPKTPGDGRVYHIAFTATDASDNSCTGEVTVCVPHDRRRGAHCVDGGPLFSSIP